MKDNVEYLWRRPGTRTTDEMYDELALNEEIIEHESHDGLRVFGYLVFVVLFYILLFGAWLVYQHAL